MSSLQNSKFLDEGMKLVAYCPVCDTRFNPMEAHVLAKEGETHLVHVRCRKCMHSILALVLINQVGASSVGLLTDLSYEDVIKLRTGDALKIDDVIDTHQWIETGDWSQAFGSVNRDRISRVIKRKTKVVDERKNC